MHLSARPPDAAFGRTLSYFNISAEELLSDVPLLRSVLSFHVVPSLVMAADVPAERTWLDTLKYGGEAGGQAGMGHACTVRQRKVSPSSEPC